MHVAKLFPRVPHRVGLFCVIFLFDSCLLDKITDPAYSVSIHSPFNINFLSYLFFILLHFLELQIPSPKSICLMPFTFLLIAPSNIWLLLPLFNYHFTSIGIFNRIELPQLFFSLKLKNCSHRNKIKNFYAIVLCSDVTYFFSNSFSYILCGNTVRKCNLLCEKDNNYHLIIDLYY